MLLANLKCNNKQDKESQKRDEDESKKGLRSTRLNKFVWFHQKKNIKVVSKFVSTFYQFRSHWNTVRCLLTTQSITQIYKLSKASKHPHVGIFNLIAGFLHKNYTFWPLDCLNDFHFKNKIKLSWPMVSFHSWLTKIDKFVRFQCLTKIHPALKQHDGAFEDKYGLTKLVRNLKITFCTCTTELVTDFSQNRPKVSQHAQAIGSRDELKLHLRNKWCPAYILL